MVKVLIWQRRVGKSILLKQIIRYLVLEEWRNQDQIFYMNKEFPEYDTINSYQDLLDLLLPFVQRQKGRFLITIDEIQEIEHWEKAINGILSKHAPQAEIIITGSNSHLLSGELATLLSGRYLEIPVYPLSYDELQTFTKAFETDQYFENYLQYGGLPWRFEMNQDNEVISHYLQSVYNTIVLKDIVTRFAVKNIDFFQTLYKYIFATIGNVFSAKNISDYLKSQHISMSVDSVLNYLSYGEDAFILYKVKSQDIKTKKIFSIYNKYYAGDIGLRNSIVGYQFARDISGLLENIVFLWLKKYGFSIAIGRLPQGKEVDFVAEKNWRLIYIQVATTILDPSTLKREYSGLESIDDNWEKYVVTMDKEFFGVRNGIKHSKIQDFEKILASF